MNIVQPHSKTGPWKSGGFYQTSLLPSTAACETKKNWDSRHPPWLVCNRNPAEKSASLPRSAIWASRRTSMFVKVDWILKVSQLACFCVIYKLCSQCICIGKKKYCFVSDGQCCLPPSMNFPPTPLEEYTLKLSDQFSTSVNFYSAAWWIER